MNSNKKVEKMFGSPVVKYNSVLKVKTDSSFLSCPITHSLDVAPDKSLQGPEPQALLCKEGDHPAISMPPGGVERVNEIRGECFDSRVNDPGQIKHDYISDSSLIHPNKWPFSLLTLFLLKFQTPGCLVLKI